MTITRADQVGTKAEAARAFLQQRSGRLLLVVAIGLAIVRAFAGPFGAADVTMIVTTFALVGPFEWIVHRYLLHAPTGSRRMGILRTGTGHVEHHKDPGELRWLMLCWRDAVVFTLALGAIAAAFALPIATLFGAGSMSTFLTTWTVTSIGLLHYEWTHLLVHTRYRCQRRYYRTLEAHHRLHHYRNEHYWLGVTARSGDRLLGTMPERGEVELSPTARTLDHA